MSTTTGFVLFLVLTVSLLGVVVVTGRTGRRRAHLATVITTVLSLGITIWFAEQLGELYDLESAGWITPVHLLIAKITVFAYLPPIITGWLTFRGRQGLRKIHARFAYLVLLLTVLTAVTGTAMILSADPIAAG